MWLLDDEVVVILNPSALLRIKPVKDMIFQLSHCSYP
jgi:hypothetical protein